MIDMIHFLVVSLAGNDKIDRLRKVVEENIKKDYATIRYEYMI